MKHLIVAALFLSLLPTAARAQLVVHEWGTFTSLQDETGRSVGGINSDDERLPEFVHSVRADLIQSDPRISKGVPRSHADVTMRLETPVMYFHLPAGAAPMTVDVSASFKGGWLTQYYPDAAVDAPGLALNGTPGRLNSQTTGTLAWKNLKVGGEGAPPKTADAVWLAPRNVDAANVAVKSADGLRTESERYLFYRGVGHLDSPVMFRRNQDQIEILSHLDPDSGLDAQSIRNIWQYEMREDGSCAFKVILPLKLTKAQQTPLGNISANTADADFSAGNLPKLRALMHEALVSDGLFPDEAAALLNTWEVSYFKSPGKRILFLMPQTWTDRYLPIKLSVRAKISRTMVGRVELVTEQQRANLKQIVTATDPNVQWANYTMLGRFRNALVLDEQKRNPSVALDMFISARSLKGFVPN